VITVIVEPLTISNLSFDPLFERGLNQSDIKVTVS